MTWTYQQPTMHRPLVAIAVANPQSAWRSLLYMAGSFAVAALVAATPIVGVLVP